MAWMMPKTVVGAACMLDIDELVEQTGPEVGVVASDKLV